MGLFLILFICSSCCKKYLFLEISDGKTLFSCYFFRIVILRPSASATSMETEDKTKVKPKLIKRD